MENKKKIINQHKDKIKTLKKHNRLYFTDDKPQISDSKYDEIKNEIIALEKKYTFLKENSSIKYVQNFSFGSNIIIKDISKVVGMKIDTVKKFLIYSNITGNSTDNELIEKEYFKDDNYRKVNKKLILDIAVARIKEISEVMLFKNINTVNFLKKKSPLFLNIPDQTFLMVFKDYFLECFSKEKKIDVNFLEISDPKNLYHNAIKLVQFGWKSEAVPIIAEKKSLLSRFFDSFFK